MKHDSSDLKLISVADLARRFGMSPSTLRRRALRGDGPPAVQFGSSIMFRMSVVRAWIAENERAGRDRLDRPAESLPATSVQPLIKEPK